MLLTEVYLAPGLAKNIVSYGKLEKKGFALAYDGERRTLPRRSDGLIAFDVAMERNVLYVQRTPAIRQSGAHDAIMAALEADDATDVAGDVQAWDFADLSAALRPSRVRHDRTHGKRTSIGYTAH